MKSTVRTRVVAIALFLFTAATVIAYPTVRDSISKLDNIAVDPSIVIPPQRETAKIEVVFALDTTGSMGGLIQAAKEKIWSIASTMVSARSAPEIRMGLVAYRDRGDAYVTRVLDLSSDLDSMYAQLMDFQAAGGGDGPESVNQALYDAVNTMSWSQDRNTYKVVFLVGDAPPHMDYPDEVKYPVIVNTAREKGILINAIQCGLEQQTRTQWQQIAQLGGGEYFQVDQAGSAVAVSTPFDRNLAELSRKIDDTRLYFGDKLEKVRQREKLAAADKLHTLSSEAALARRAEFNASKSGKMNLYGVNELVESVGSGRVDLAGLAIEELPESMQDLSLSDQKTLLAEKAAERKELERQIQDISKQRKEYLAKKAKESGGYKDSLDEKIYSAVRAQSAATGLVYDDDVPSY